MTYRIFFLNRQYHIAYKADQALFYTFNCPARPAFNAAFLTDHTADDAAETMFLASQVAPVAGHLCGVCADKTASMMWLEAENWADDIMSIQSDDDLTRRVREIDDHLESSRGPVKGDERYDAFLRVRGDLTALRIKAREAEAVAQEEAQWARAAKIEEVEAAAERRFTDVDTTVERVLADALAEARAMAKHLKDRALYVDEIRLDACDTRLDELSHVLHEAYQTILFKAQRIQRLSR